MPCLTVFIMDENTVFNVSFGNWKTMKPRFFATNAHLLVCTGPDCAARGSRVLFGAVWRGLERERLAYYTQGGSLRLTECGCLGACGYGPNLVCYRKHGDGSLEEAWYAAVDFPACMRVALALHEQQALPSAGRFDPEPRAQQD